MYYTYWLGMQLMAFITNCPGNHISYAPPMFAPRRAKGWNTTRQFVGPQLIAYLLMTTLINTSRTVTFIYCGWSEWLNSTVLTDDVRTNYSIRLFTRER